MKPHSHSKPCCFSNWLFREALCSLHTPRLAADEGWEKNMGKGLNLSGVSRVGSPDGQEQDEAKGKVLVY